MRIIISGGGIGGLTAALCCLHHGHAVTVLEQAADLGEVGAGLQISPNAMKVYEALGLAERLADAGFRPQGIEGRMGVSGMRLFSFPLGEAAVKRWGSPYLHIHRADLINVLQTALQAKAPDVVRLGAQVEGYVHDSEGVAARLAEGSKIVGDVLIGADGIRSPIRAQMLGSDQPQFTGNVAWRAVVPVDRLGGDAPDPVACAWMGRSQHAVTYLLRGGELANFVGVVERGDWTSESWTEQGSRAQALADFAGWHPTIRRMIEASDQMFRWALFDRAPLQAWTDGRVALLGDACHPMLPFMAQGAAMAIEDAWVLASSLTVHSGVETGLKAYQSTRLARASKVQAGSRANARAFHQRTALGRLSTYGPMWLAGRITPGLIQARQDWIYGHDVTG